MKTLTSYYEWANVLKKFANGDDSALYIMEKSKFKIDAGTADKFYSLINETYKTRKQKWIDNMFNNQNSLQLKTIDEIDMWVRNWKNNLTPLMSFVSLPAFPDDIKKVLEDDLKSSVKEIREEIIKKLTNGHSVNNEKLLFYLKNFDIYENKIDLNTDIQKKAINNKGRKIIF